MKKTLLRRQIPTIIGLIILFLGAGAGVILVGDSVPFLPRAAPEHAPRNLQITNVTHESVTISWQTDEPATGFIQYGPDQSLGLTAVDDRSEISGDVTSFRNHYVTLRNLSPETTYYFKITSGGTVYDNQGDAYEVSTGPVLGVPGSAVTMYGKVMTQAQTPAEGVIVYVRRDNAAPLSALVRNSGDWSVPLASMRSLNLTQYANITNPTGQFNLEVTGLDGQSTLGVTDNSNIQPVPPITLNKTFDFTSEATQTNEPPVNQEETPDSELGIEVEEETTVKLLNPSFDGEAINTTRPEFQGEAPANIEISITVESPVAYKDTVITDSSGAFVWEPPDDLEPGNHTITLSWIENGVRYFMQRNFVVMAQGESGLPALTSTPSATITPSPSPTPLPTPTPTPTPTTTPTPTPTPSPSPTATPTPRTSQPATDSGIPTAGSGTYSMLILLAGLGLIGGGIVSSRLLSD